MNPDMQAAAACAYFTAESDDSSANSPPFDAGMMSSDTLYDRHTHDVPYNAT